MNFSTKTDKFKEGYCFKFYAFIKLKLSKVNFIIEYFIRIKEIRSKEDSIFP